jgi:hypothetical protein
MECYWRPAYLHKDVMGGSLTKKPDPKKIRKKRKKESKRLDTWSVKMNVIKQYITEG